MKFTKMQGIGNDYVYINCFEEHVEDPARVAQLVSERHFGIGSDGLILICPSEVADCRIPASVTSENGLLLISTTQSAAVISLSFPSTGNYRNVYRYSW